MEVRRPLKRNLPRLGQPDIYPQDPRQKEDELTSVNVKHGYSSVPLVSGPNTLDEFGTAKHANIDAFGVYFSALLSEKHRINTIRDTQKKKQFVNTKEIWYVHAKTKNAVDNWFRDLANGTKSLGQLGKRIPIFNSNLRHKGAFEQAYNGFVMVTKRIWLEKEFEELLIESLKTIMSDFTGEQGELDDKKVEYLKNHVTRRSAGLPFLVQAIVVSEDKQESKTLEWTMNCLLDILEDSKSETYQKIHCLNILKALIKDYNLGKKVIPFIERTIIVTIESFKSDDFPIRNCANMLMRVVIDRTFGVNRLRDDIHKRNTLSFEKFFTEYPNLFKKMLGYLSEGLVNRKALAPVHAVIIILTRLRPSLEPGEDYTPEKVILPFVKPLLELARTCPDFKLRELSANLAVQLESYCVKTNAELIQLLVVNIHELTTQAIETVASKGEERIDRNKLHGNLFILKAWLARCDVMSESDEEAKTIFSFIENLVHTMAYGNKFNFSVNHMGRCSIDENLRNFLHNFKEKFGPSASAIRLISLDLIDLLHLYLPVGGKHNWDQHLLLLLELEDQLDWEPYRETMIFKTFSILVTSEFISSDSEGSRSLLLKIVDIITEKSERKYSLNLKAALVRLIRHLYYRTQDFSDKLMLNLDLDSTAAMLTPVDLMNQSSELHSGQEKWAQRCDEGILRDNKAIMLQVVHPLMDFSQYSEFVLPSTSDVPSRYRDTGTEAYSNELQHTNMIKPLSPSIVNTPRGIELMALACKTYDFYKLDDKQSSWMHGGESIHCKLVSSTRLIKSLPDCDIKPLTLLFASKLFRDQLTQLRVRPEFEFKTLTYKVELMALREFSELMETLVDCQHDRITRETCAHILSNTMELAFDCWCQDLKETLMNLLSTLIKLCQDEECEVRRASLDIVANLHSSHFPEALDQVGKLDKLIVLVTKKLLDPKKAEDAMDLFDLFTRVIFNHSKNFSVNQSEERESLFDKTKPNIFADHVASIHNTFKAAKEFFKQIEPIDINTMKFSSQVVMELEYLDMATHSEQLTGDYSWRLKDAVKRENNSGAYQERDNRTLLNGALDNVLQSLGYFNYTNMLTDTNFGYHESSIFKRLAFAKLVVDCTSQDDCTIQLLDQVRKGLDDTINQSCATTILCKCRELLMD